MREAGVHLRAHRADATSRRRLGVLLRLLRTHLPRAPLDALSVLDFFLRIGATMPREHAAGRGLAGRDAGSAPRSTCIDGDDAVGPLLGRAANYVPGLHFEACYYQAIEFCIERSISALRRRRAGRAQARARPHAGDDALGACASPIPISPRAIADFCARERVDVAHTVDELEAREPVQGTDAVV